MSDTQRALVRSDGGDDLEYAIAAWLHAKQSRTKSERTSHAYATTLRSFQQTCRMAGTDLDGPTKRVHDLAQAWSTQPWRPDRKSVSSATRNQRLAIVASFYDFARKHEHLSIANPITDIERSPVQRFAKARPLSQDTIAHGLAAIDRSTVVGMRDYALLAVAFNTGMRLSSLMSLTIGSITHTRTDVTVSFVAKGDKYFTRKLPHETGAALLKYIKAAYHVSSLHDLSTKDPVWLSVAPNNYLGRLGADGARDILVKHFGVSKFHTTRHSLAKLMQESGATLSEIQAVLGHSDIATTGEYMEALSSDVNPYADAIEKALGITSGDAQ